MQHGTLEYEIYLNECRHMQHVEELIDQADYEDRVHNAPIQCRGCNCAMPDVGEAYCEDCRETAQAGYHDSNTIFNEEDIPF